MGFIGLLWQQSLKPNVWVLQPMRDTHTLWAWPQGSFSLCLPWGLKGTGLGWCLPALCPLQLSVLLIVSSFIPPPSFRPLSLITSYPQKTKKKNMKSCKGGWWYPYSLIRSHLFRVQFSFCAHNEGKWTNSVKKQSHKPSGLRMTLSTSEWWPPRDWMVWLAIMLLTANCIS